MGNHSAVKADIKATEPTSRIFLITAEKLTIKKFNKLNVIGRGGFGKVIRN
jgi:hypothetical protein